MTPVDLSDFTVCVGTFPFVGTVANAVPAAMNAPTANKAMVFIIPPIWSRQLTPIYDEIMRASAYNPEIRNARIGFGAIRHLPYFDMAGRRK